MESAQQFIVNYLRDRAVLDAELQRLSETFHRRFYTEEYMGLLVRAWNRNPTENFVSADGNELEAKVITMTRRGDQEERFRYHVRFSFGRWRIHRKESECFSCKGTGKRNDKPCDMCHGKGWMDWLCDVG